MAPGCSAEKSRVHPDSTWVPPRCHSTQMPPSFFPPGNWGPNRWHLGARVASGCALCLECTDGTAPPPGCHPDAT